MIRYSLKCADGHAFESWFQSAEAFDKLSVAGMVGCAVCGAAEVIKAIIAPRVRPSRDSADGRPKEAPRPGQGALKAPASDIEKAVAALRKQVEQKADYVGLEFAAEARAIHNGDSPERAIYGEARPEEARKLVEEGVPVAPLPFLPNRKTN